MRRWPSRWMLILPLACGGAAVSATTALSETSSWQQRVAPAKPAKQSQKSKVESKKVAPTERPSNLVPGAVSTGAPRAGGEASLGPTSLPSGGTGSRDPAYEAFDQGKYLTALELAQKAAETGDPQAHTLIARLYVEGLGVPQSAETAAKWYAKAAELGDIEGAFGLGVLYAKGDGVKKDAGKAAELFEKAASKGHASAAYNLALLFLRGQGKVENPRRGFMLMQYAAEKGVVAAQYDLGTLYTTGTGTDPNAFEAAKWFGKAANAGYGEAEIEYAVVLFKGHGVPVDEKRGAELFRSAAHKGYAVAQNRLARCYAYGRGVKKDALEAAKWHLVAKESGVEDEVLEALLKKLPQKDRVAAAQAATEWRDRWLLQ